MLFCPSAQAGFIISSASMEFTQDGPRHQDIELISRSDKNDYVVAEVSEIVHPGAPDEQRQVVEDPAQGGLLVSPDKTVLAGKGRKVLRFILLKEPDAQEHIYRVAIKPVIGTLGTDDKLGLKILIGYEVLVVVRPKVVHASYLVERRGNLLSVTNSGNANVLLQSGKQCSTPQMCKNTPVVRVYAGQSAKVTLPVDAPVSYSVWDGKQTVDRTF